MSAAGPPPSRFQLIRRLAAGGMGEVLLARFAGDARMSVGEGLVVIKRAIPGSGQRSEQNQMLQEEGRVGLRLRHANLVETFSLESYGDEPILVIEYLAGKSMAQVLGAAKKNRQPVPVGIALRILRDAACGLHFAHTLQIGGEKLGLVHRDVSPANIFVTFDGRAKVIDFGVAKAKDSEIKTSTGILKGKTGYMSPEQVQGQGLDLRSDVWSLGVFFWELLLAERLFISPSPAQTLNKILKLDIPPPSSRRADLPPVVDRLCARLLERNPDVRIPTCADLVNEIDAIAQSANEVQLQQFALERFPEDGQVGLEEARNAARTIGKDAPPSGLVDGSFGDWNEKTIDQPVMSVVYQRANLVGTFENTAQGAAPAEEANTIPVPQLIFSSEAELGPVEQTEKKTKDWADISNTNSKATLKKPPAQPSAAAPAPSPAARHNAAMQEPPRASASQRQDKETRSASTSPPPPVGLLDIGLVSFGSLALVMGLALSFLATGLKDQRELILYRYLGAQGSDVVVAHAQDAPLGVTPTPFVLRDSQFQTGGAKNTPTPVSADDLKSLLSKSGVLDRAQMPASARAKVSAILPLVISMLGLFSLCIGVPAIFRLAAPKRLRARAGGLLATGALFVWGFVFGWMSWPGSANLGATDEVPRLDFKDIQR